VRLVVCALYLAALVPVIRAFGVTGAGAALVAAATAMGLGMLWMLRRTNAAISNTSTDESSCAPDVERAKGARP
jgi:Na+-driven multidrug efflux pump